MALWTGDAAHPIVSICCATYNHEHYIEDALKGFLEQQTAFPFEILIHDDASSDGTVAILTDYQRHYPSIIRLILQTDNQLSKGRRITGEFLMPEARGRYIAICEGDDFWTDPDKLARQVRFLDDNPGYVICYSDCIGLDEQSGELCDIPGVRWDLSSRELQETSSIFTLTACFRNVVQRWPVEISRAPYGDLSLWSMLGDYGAGKYLAGVGSSRYRIHGGGLHSMQSQARRRQMQLETMMVLCLYRLKRGETSIARAHIESILVLSLKMFGSGILTGILRRATRHLSRRLLRGRRSAAG